MLRFRRPARPDGFDDHVAQARKHVAELVTRGIRPKSEDFKERWGAFKSHFIAAQHRKCGFCESKVTQVDTGDVEHYRPKAAITCLPADRAKWGRELPDSGNSEGRCPDGVCEWGYHFLAYEWDNYLFACGRCNQAWKGNLFPLAEPRVAERPTPESVADETPLLLNPYEGPTPTDHLRFLRDSNGNGPLGQVAPRELSPGFESPHGRATIDTCHLDRPSLLDARSEKAEQIFHRLKELDMSGKKGLAETSAILDAIRRLGAAEAAYAGLVRATFEVWTGFRWEEAFGPDGG